MSPDGGQPPRAAGASLSSSSSRTLAQVALFAALMAALGLVPKVDLPFGVPITLQTLGVMLAGCLLGARRAALAMALFLVAVALGLPLLPGGRGGIAPFLAPSGGFLLGFLPGAAVSGAVMQAWPARAQGWRSAAGVFLAAAAGGMAVLYLCGIPWLAWSARMPLAKAALACLVFLPGDLLKCAICVMAVRAVWRALPRWRLELRA